VSFQLCLKQFLTLISQMAGIADDLEPSSADDMEQVLMVYSTQQPKVSNESCWMGWDYAVCPDTSQFY
jgi:hypothetical protein